MQPPPVLSKGKGLSAGRRNVRTRMAPQARREQLLDCAIRAFAEHGVARTTHAQVAKRAEVSVSAVHSYFRTRKDLVHATLEEVETRLMKIVYGVDIEHLSAHDALFVMVSEFDQAAAQTPDVVKVWLDWGTDFRAEVWSRYLEMEEEIQVFVRRALARGKIRGEISGEVDVSAAARLFVGGGRTVGLLRLAGGGAEDIRILVDHLVRSVTGIGFDHWGNNVERP